ncbi:RNA-binding protein 4B-like isoform X2 [Oxyura jamaicensis]|uniref:RNA-binding protein 4B-like isoform X2 n=1 Tax=Oxyura jamaicensis TaxID=8884 RepID=UPI0015A52748|nr:RNA-binding protein 4B-like isoform X2 [Oxyura jamaicensis]
MVKLFIGNLPREATEQEIRSLFEQYGKVLECDIVKNYGFVHIEDRTAAEDAIRNLHHHKLHGVCINVEASKNKSKASTKLHVGNISPTCTNLELRAKFEEYGPVIECDIVKDYAFVHMERAEDAVEAIRGLDNAEFQGDARAGAAFLSWGCFHPEPALAPWSRRARGLPALQQTRHQRHGGHQRPAAVPTLPGEEDKGQRTLTNFNDASGKEGPGAARAARRDR